MKDLLISKLREMVKVKKPKVKKTEPTEADRSDFAAWQDKKERDREPSDIEDERNQMAKHYGQQSEAIDFSKKTILGKAARPMAAQMLKKRKAELQKEPALANKGGAVAKELKVFSKDTYRHRGDPKPEPQRSSTDLRTHLAYVLADKLEELKQSTVDSAAAKRVAQVRSKSFRGEEKPVFKGGTGGTNKPEQIGTRSGAGKGVIGKRLSTLYKGKTSKGVAKREESTSLQDRIVGMLLEKKKVNPWAVCHASTGPEKSDKFERCVIDVKEKHGIKEGTLADRLINILAEAFLGTSRDYVARAMSREDKGSSMKDRSKKGKALASVINKQPKVIKAKAEKKAADDAQEKANRAKGGNSNLRSSDSATHWRNNWPSGSWGSA